MTDTTDPHLIDTGQTERGGGLGGEYGYGADVTSDVYTMHRYYWDDCTCGWEDWADRWDDDHPHASTCYQTELHRRGARNYAAASDYDPTRPSHEAFRAAGGYSAAAEQWNLPPVGTAIHCTCGRTVEQAAARAAHPHPISCPAVRPNFTYHPTGTTVHWYKYIGRGMQIAGPAMPADFVHRCIQSQTEAAS